MKSQRNYGWVVLLIFPLIGIFGMVLVLLGGRANQTNNTTLQAIPSPAPLKTTPVPTVTVIPIMDNLAPDLPLTDFEGKSYKLSELTGQVVVVNFWATWCPPCVKEMPVLQEFAQSHPTIMMLSVTDPQDGQTLDDIKAFIDQYGLKDLDFGLDKNGLLRLNFNALNLPMTFVLDQEGYVRFRQIGAVTEDDLNYYIDELS